MSSVEPSADRALLRLLPGLRGRYPQCALGLFPTPVHRLDAHHLRGASIFVKREDLSSPVYGGNKVRTLEGHFGAAKQGGFERIWATGAYGSNHAAATVLHAKRVGLKAGVILFHQPSTEAAHENLSAMLSQRPDVLDIGNFARLPLAMHRVARDRRNYVMTPGGATPLGSVGHVSAALEFAEQVERGECPPPRQLVIAVGSTCTTAGVLCGLAIAANLGIAFGPGKHPLPKVHAVRATPWPVTSPWRIVSLAHRTSQFLQSFVGAPARVGKRRLGAMLRVEQRYLGRGYGQPMACTRGAIALMRQAGGPEVDSVYAGKSAAHLFQLALDPGAGTILYWATKSTAELPRASDNQLRDAPLRMQRWLREDVL